MALKERLIDLLEDDENIFDATDLVTAGDYDGKACTRYDLTALILKVSGYALQTDEHYDNIRLPMNAPYVEKEWVDYENKVGMIDQRYVEIPALARQLWEAEYGKREAKELPLYDLCPDDTSAPARWWDEMEALTAAEVIAFLKGHEPIALNGPLHND